MKNKIQKFANLVQIQTLETLNRRYGSTPDWTMDSKTKIIPGKKYTKVDVGNSGKFMVDEDGNIFGIKGYGKINKKKHYGNLNTINLYFWGEYAPVKLSN